MANLRPLNNSIIFIFEDEVVGGMFNDVSAGGIVIGRNHTFNANDPRWGTVTAVGPRVIDDIKVGDRILLPPGRWTEGFELEKDSGKIWRTTDDEVIAVETP